MKIRAILVCTVLLLAAVPSFALPLCAECNEWNMCETIPGAIERCYSYGGSCWTEPDPCSPPRAATVLAEWKVASIEISRPSQESITVTAPSPEVEATEVRATELVEPK